MRDTIGGDQSVRHDAPPVVRAQIGMGVLRSPSVALDACSPYACQPLRGQRGVRTLRTWLRLGRPAEAPPRVPARVSAGGFSTCDSKVRNSAHQIIYLSPLMVLAHRRRRDVPPSRSATSASLLTQGEDGRDRRASRRSRRRGPGRRVGSAGRRRQLNGRGGPAARRAWRRSWQPSSPRCGADRES